MIPVRKGEYKLFIVQICVRILWVMNNQRTTEAIWVLAVHMRVVPVGTRLINLDESANHTRSLGRRLL
jgi:hypothetical protein